MATRGYERDMDRDRDGQKGAYNAEHWLAWVMALAALVMGAIGLLVGFGMIGDNVAGVEVGEAAGTELVNWQEGVLWLLPAVAIGLLSLALHNTEHHTRRPIAQDDTNRGLFNAEHGLAYLMALATIAAASLGLLVGFDVFDNGNTFVDGVLWSIASVLTGVVTVTLHTVRHHQTMEADEAVIVRLIEERTGTVGTTGTAAPRTTTERAQERGQTRP